MGKISEYMSRFGLFAGLICLCACSEDKQEIVPDPTPDGERKLEAIRLHIGASGTMETKAYGGDENAEEGEFINTLHVFVVDENGLIEAAINANDELTADEKVLAGVGNLTNFTTTVDLMPGSKTIYAFANMDNVTLVESDNDMKSILAGLETGTKWNSEINDYVLDNPAADINENLNKQGTPKGTEHYIPMSVQQTVDVNIDGQSVDVALVRLVSKVRAALTNRQGAPVAITNISMGNFSENVSLFENSSGSNERNITYRKDYGDAALEIPNQTEATSLPVFYVNETVSGEDPFTISLTIDEKVMTGSTKTIIIPRNSVLPLALSLSQTDLELEITAQVAPIGGYPVTVLLSNPSLTDHYHINLPEGCTFGVTGKFKPSVGNEVPVGSMFLALDEGEPQSIVKIDQSGTSGTATGYVTALSGQKATLKYTATANNAQFYKEGTLTIHTVPLQDMGTQYPSYTVESQNSLTQWGEAPRWYEIVPMMQKNP